MRLARLGAAGAFLLAASAAAGADYELRLDERRPLQVEMTLRVDPAEARRLTVEKGREALLLSVPACPSGPLAPAGTGAWMKPIGCAAVTWSARLTDQDAEGLDAIAPASAWSAKHGLWILTDALPWLSPESSPSGTVLAVARMESGEVSRSFRLSDAQAPLTVLIGKGAPRRFRSGDMEMRVFGEAPAGAEADDLQQKVADTWGAWKRDLVVNEDAAPSAIDIFWTRPPAGAEPGFFASSGSHAILMQHVPEGDAPEAKLRSAVMLIGAHEGFHALGAGIPGARPAWVNESWASYFAYQAAKRHLDAASLAEARDLIEMPAPRSLLAAQRAWDAGDQSQAFIFYGKGARFWGEVEGVLNGPANASGKLAALIQRSRGMAGMDWSSAEGVAAWLDAHSGGRARPIVLCYLEGAGCP